MLFDDLLAAAAIVAAVAILSALLAFYRASVAGHVTLDVGAHPLRSGLAWGIAAIACGAIAVSVYEWLGGPGRLVLFPMIGVGGALALSALAVVARRPLRVGDLPVVVGLNLAWGLGFGVAIPLVLG